MTTLFKKEYLDKARRYLRRNGLKDTFFAAIEKMYPMPYSHYVYQQPGEKTLRKQRNKKWEHEYKFSILVPTYRTDSFFLEEMIDSVINQTYRNWELILADASDCDCVEKVVRNYQDSRIVYVKLDNNGGISENSNQGLKEVTGEYTVLLDHDDTLTKDALFEVAKALMEARKYGVKKSILYSDEDKCDENGITFYEVHKKKNFNFELILSNNYFCHLLVMDTNLLKQLKFRKEFDGAQDYDLVLRAIEKILPDEEKIEHIPKVLYHWRCHKGSTAGNTDSKQYAYEAGRKALENFSKQMGWKAKAISMKHLGFYRLEYEQEFLRAREDVGILGGCILDKKNRICGGIYTYNGKRLYEGLHREFSGYMHRATLRQEADVVDIRLMRLNSDFATVLCNEIGMTLKMDKEGRVLTKYLPKDIDFMEISQKICTMARTKGYRVVWDPSWKEKIK